MSPLQCFSLSFNIAFPKCVLADVLKAGLATKYFYLKILQAGIGYKIFQQVNPWPNQHK